MTLPVSPNPISLSQVNVELGLSATAQISLNDAAVRTLFGKPSGAISFSDGHGKRDRSIISHTFSGHTADAYLNVETIPGYRAGKSDITITVNSGIYLYATSTGGAGLTVVGGNGSDTVTLVNNGFIMGRGGDGGWNSNGGSGGPALSIGRSITINNTNSSAYIGGGGGGGGSANSSTAARVGGGGGAGGGNGGGSGANGGGIGGSGGNGVATTGGVSGGGGGGRVFPGTGGAGGLNVAAGLGGTAGGGGAGYRAAKTGGGSYGGAGGSANNAGGAGYKSGGSGGGGGGGGGWGASGGVAAIINASSWAPGGGGRAVQLNGYGVTWVSGSTARVYGAVS